MNVQTVLQTLKFEQLLAPQGVDNDDFSGNAYIDTQGLGAVLFLIQTGSLAAAIGSTAEGTAPKIEECDTSGGSYTAVDDAALADAIADSEDNKLFAIVVDLNKSHKRYMRVNTPHAGDGSATLSYAAILAIGFPSRIAPQTVIEMGVTELVKA